MQVTVRRLLPPHGGIRALPPFAILSVTLLSTADMTDRRDNDRYRNAKGQYDSDVTKCIRCERVHVSASRRVLRRR